MIANFKEKEAEMANEYFAHNQLVRDLLMYLLCLEDRNDKPGFILIKLVFGINAAKQFLNQGINYTFIDQKVGFFRKISGQNRKKKKKDEDFSQKSFSKSLGNSTDKSSSSENLNSEINEKKSLNLDFLRKQIQKLGMQKIILLMKIYGVPMSYIDHWIWLHLQLGFDSKEFVSFHFLLSEVYNFDLYNYNPEIESILNLVDRKGKIGLM